jgi:hypothetical protein
MEIDEHEVKWLIAKPSCEVSVVLRTIDALIDEELRMDVYRGDSLQTGLKNLSEAILTGCLCLTSHA